MYIVKETLKSLTAPLNIDSKLNKKDKIMNPSESIDGT